MDAEALDPSSDSEIEEELHHPRMADNESDDSDVELRAAFQSGLLKSGIYKEEKAPRPTINNVEGMLEKLEEMESSKLDWLERLDVTVVRKSRKDEEFSQNLAAEEAQAMAKNRVFTVHNDFKREFMLLTQAKDAVLEAIPKLKEAGILTVRPDDYFAEMAKKDDHMKKIRGKLLVLKRQKEKTEKFRSQLKLKKYGKKVQQAVEAERRKKKKEMLDNVKKFRKGKKDNMDFLDDDNKGKRGGKQSQMQQGLQKRTKSRSFRDTKFGYGGRKKGNKSNTTNSTNDTAGFRRSKPQVGRNSNKRPGKGRRQKMKNSNKR